MHLHRRLRMLLVFMAFVLTAVQVQPAHAQQTSARDIAQLVLASTVLLVMTDANGQPISLGSGFVVKDGVVATNVHVIEGAAEGYAKLVGVTAKYDIAGVVGIDSVHDLALLSVKAITARSLPLADSSNLATGDTVYVAGNPRGLEGTFSQGIVSGFREIGSDKLTQITAPISPGSSGGPVVDVKGEVVGVAVATYRGGQNLNFAIPASYLSALVSNITPPRALSTSSKAGEQKSFTADLGGRNTEGVTGEQFAWTYSVLRDGLFTFSLRNRLREPVKNVRYLIVAYDSKGDPLDYTESTVSYVAIPGGLGKRVTGRLDDSVRDFKVKVEIRILDFEIVSE